MESGINQGRRYDLSGGGLVRSLKGWKNVADVKGRVKGDQRIPGTDDFVLNILSQAKENFERKVMLKNRGYNVDNLADTIASLYDITINDILSKGRHSPRVEARSLFCYVAFSELGSSVTDLASLTGMSVSAISYAVKRGKDIAKEKDFRLVLNY